MDYSPVMLVPSRIRTVLTNALSSTSGIDRKTTRAPSDRLRWGARYYAEQSLSRALAVASFADLRSRWCLVLPGMPSDNNGNNAAAYQHGWHCNHNHAATEYIRHVAPFPASRRDGIGDTV